LAKVVRRLAPGVPLGWPPIALRSRFFDECTFGVDIRTQTCSHGSGAWRNRNRDRPSGTPANGTPRGFRQTLLAAAAQHEAALGQLGEPVLERREVAREERVERAAGGALRANPAAQDSGAGALLRLRQQVEQDAQLGPVVELAGEEGQRIDAERGAELVLGQAEQRQQMVGVAAQKS
jgi:hypothetical protein